MAKNKTFPEQFEAMVDFMEEHPDMALGIRHNEKTNMTKAKNNELWHELAEKLDEIGPTKRTLPQWQKVYTDLKLKAKNKLSFNRKEVRATGGGKNKQKPLTATEERIAEILALRKSAHPTGKSFGVNASASSSSSSMSPSSSSSDESDNDQVERSDQHEESDTPPPAAFKRDSRTQKTYPNRRANRKGADCKEELLIKQTEFLRKITKNSNVVAEYARKTFELKESMAKEKLKITREKEIRKARELEFKVELIKLKKRKLDLL